MVAEVSRKLQREILAGNETKEGRLRRLDFIHSSSQILALPFELAVVSGELDVEMKRRVKGWGIVDSILLSIARSSEAKVVTGDDHFRSLKEVIFIK